MKGSNILAFLGGAIVGGALALLLAPQSGEKTREQIRDFIDEEVDNAKDFAGRAVHKARGAVGRGMSQARGVVDDVKDYVDREEKKLARAVDRKLANIEKAVK